MGGEKSTGIISIIEPRHWFWGLTAIYALARMRCMSMQRNQQQGDWERLPVAGYNRAPRWPGGYFEVLAEAGVPERQHSFYAHWVRQFFNRNPGRSRRSLGVREIRVFLGALRRDVRMKAWQVEQARAALIMYYEQFRGIALGDLAVLDAPLEGLGEERGGAALESGEQERPIPHPREAPKIVGIVLPRICSRRGRTFARYRSCSGTRMSRPR